MTRYYKVECPRCQGRGVISYHLVLERKCPLCCGEGLILDYTHPIAMMSQPEIELTTLRPRTLVDPLAEMIPLDRQKRAALLTLRRSARPAPAEDRPASHDAPAAGGHFAGEDDPREYKHRFVEGAESERRDFSGRMRQR